MLLVDQLEPPYLWSFIYTSQTRRSVDFLLLTNSHTIATFHRISVASTRTRSFGDVELERVDEERVDEERLHFTIRFQISRLIKTIQDTKPKHHPHNEKAMSHRIMQGDQMKSIIMKVDVSTDEEKSLGGGGRSVAPVDHHHLHFILGCPHHRRDGYTKNRDGFAPAFFGCPSSQRCGPAMMRRMMS